MSTAATSADLPADDASRGGHEHLYLGADVRRLAWVFLDLALARAFTLISSPALLDELDDTLCAKFAVSGEDLRLIRAKLEGVISLVDPSFRLQVVADDPDDDRVLECAVAGKADCIVSGDRHLLRLGSYQQVPIITVREFLSEIDRGR